MTAVLIRLLSVILLAPSFAAFLAPSAAHADDKIGLSWDGTNWSSRLTGSLFDPSVRWVPGDVRTAAFHVRNQAGDGATVAIAVESTDRDHLLRDDDIRLEARVGGADWVPLDRIGTGFRINESVLQAGESTRVQVRATFDPAATNQSQRSELRMRFRIVLTDAHAATDDPSDNETEGTGDDDGDDTVSGVLPDTGAPAVGWLIVVAGVMLGVGLALMRRRREEPDGTPR